MSFAPKKHLSIVLRDWWSFNKDFVSNPSARPIVAGNIAKFLFCGDLDFVSEAGIPRRYFDSSGLLPGLALIARKYPRQ